MHFSHPVLQIVAWTIALAWFAKAVTAARGLPTVADLLRLATPSPSQPSLTVIVPAKNEQNDIVASLESLLAQDVQALQIIAVDDRSTDRTGNLMDDLAARSKDRLRVLHIEHLPPGWLGKTHAMHVAALSAQTDYLLFTDADVTFRSDALSRALAYAETEHADHLVLAPTTIIRRWDEAGVLGLFQLMGLWAGRPWRVADPDARDAIGIGAFNMIRRDAYRTTGGFETLRLEIVEDLGLGRLVKRHGLRQRMAFGRGLVNLHWASGASGLVGVMTKNMFAGFRFSLPLLLLGCLWLGAFCALPFPGIFFPLTLLPALLTILSMTICYRVLSPVTGISSWNVLLAPFAACVFIFTLLRSMLTTWRQRGVIWRGTFYPLAELKRALPPISELLGPRRSR